MIQHFAGDIPGRVAPVIENTKATSKAASLFFSMKENNGWIDGRINEWMSE